MTKHSNKGKEIYDPIKLLHEFRERKVPFVGTFFEHYTSWVDLLNSQVFNDQGYEIVCIKKETTLSAESTS